MDFERERDSKLPIRVGIAGLGRAAIFEHIPELLAMPGKFQITAVCDLLKFRRDHVEALCPGVKLYRRVEDMLDDPDIDLIDICTRSQDHVEHAMASLKRGRWTLLESPMALSQEAALGLRAQAVLSRDRLIVRHPGAFDCDCHLARKVLDDKRLGDIYDIKVRRCDYLRRDDWQSVRKCGGGIQFYALPDILLQAMALLRMPPVKMWAELKHIASLGDAPDYAHIVLRTRTQLTADVVASGAAVPPYGPSFEISGSRGIFTAMPGASEGLIRAINPESDLPRRRCSVRTPPLDDMREDLDFVEFPVSLDEEEKKQCGRAAFWEAVWKAIRTAEYFPATLDDSIEVLRLIDIIGKTAQK